MQWYVSIGLVVVAVGLLYGAWRLLEEELKKPTGPRGTAVGVDRRKNKEKKREEALKRKAAAAAAAASTRRVAEESDDDEEPEVEAENLMDRVFGGKMEPKVIDLGAEGSSGWSTVKTSDQTMKEKAYKKAVTAERLKVQQEELEAQKRAEKNRRRRQNKKEMERYAREMERAN